MKRRCRVPDDERMPAQRMQKVTSALQLPASALSGAAHFEMNGNREVIVDGCRGVLEYDEHKIRINTGKMITCFQGRCLSIKCLTSDSLIVEGFITSIEFGA
ncbi:MAG: sporulation protein [Clostridiales bacterium]|jgi:sporulation protein YqfC|nr:sporulation protein [Clostridiales bacterium]